LSKAKRSENKAKRSEAKRSEKKRSEGEKKRSEKGSRRELLAQNFWSIFVNQKYDDSYFSQAMDLKSQHHFYPTSCCGPQQQNGGMDRVDEK
jgi:hypothetical protein